MNIAISKASGSNKYAKYGTWLKHADANAEIVDLWGKSVPEAIQLLQSCHALVLSGGEDVDPERYGMPERRELCGTIDERRDELEFAVAQAAIDAQMPVLGICRGLQVLNVLYGGTLIADIRGADYIEHRSVRDSEGRWVADTIHPVEAEPGSLIRRICRDTEGEVNSAHHQAIEHIANMFAPAACAPDGIVEAIEWGDTTLGGKPFMLAVQWHPERLPWESAFSLPIARHLLFEASSYQALIR